ncbi:TPA: replication protein [Klebsiella quasipneumoniae subsp. quasipneumoniae]|nr:replication protein [Klebsiella quasipneumoniae subsp. quasipneumoniae]
MSLAALSNVTPIRPILEVVEAPRVADLDDGYTRLANALYDELIGADLTKNQGKVAHAICRKTYGFGKKLDRISDSQLAQLTRLPRQKVNKAKNELIAMKVILREGSQIGPNKNISEWTIGGCHYSGDNVTALVTKSVTKTVTGLSPKQGHTKETIQKKERNNKRLLSENSNELSDTAPEKSLPVVRPGAAVQSPNGQKWGTDDDLRAAQWMFAKVQEVASATPAPNWAGWANDIRLARNALNVTHREICKVFAWANADHFWQTNILSPAKLRQKWPTLTAQMAQPSRQRQQQETGPHWNSAEAWEEFI